LKRWRSSNPIVAEKSLVVTGFDPTSFQISAGSNIKCPDLYNTEEEADTMFSMQSKQPAE